MKRKVLRTEADVLEHCYGKEPEAVPAPPSPAQPAPAPAPPPPPAEPAPAEPTAEELVAKFVDGYTKADLTELAEQDGLDTSGTKAEIAERLVGAGFIPE